MYKSLLIISLSIMCLMFTLQSCAAYINVKIQGNEAKNIYINLTGKKIEIQNAMGHTYKQGTHILCQYVKVDMSDKNGKDIPRDDAVRYSCNLNIDENGAIAK